MHVRAGEGYGSLPACLARGLGVEFMAIKLQVTSTMTTRVMCASTCGVLMLDVLVWPVRWAGSLGFAAAPQLATLL